ncbi:hypothetical protein KPL78_01095 [Roseomonas sp. HJA6]|uniref:Secreted protein n=1 Tax=Roseomonas alba TaxID=2846776 RepID=A0ABS7A251_9PROT|nr:hypothetical protein [Neoroseomonas alba]MBW6396417.1 hypothetical protein [Neoroseomonas alba]
MSPPFRRAVGPAAIAALTLLTQVTAFGQPVPPGPTRAPGIMFDTAQLPQTHGVVARYSLGPRGEVDGLILQDGTQVQLPSHLGSELVFAARPGDAVTVRGLLAIGVPLVAAVSVRNDATGAEVVDAGGGPHGGEVTVGASGPVQTVLRGRRGEVNGAILVDGTTVRVPPHAAVQMAELLRPGATLAVRGEGRTTVFGRVIEARFAGPSMDRLTEIAGPGPRDMSPPHPPRPPRG